MLNHLFRAGTRALAVSIVVGGLLIYFTGGLQSPHVVPLVGVSIAAFFIFWLCFTFLGAKPPRFERGSTSDRSMDGDVSLATRARDPLHHRGRHDSHEFNESGESGAGDGGNGGSD